MLSHPGRGATSMSLSSISSRVKVTSMMAGDKNCNFTLCKTSQIGTFHRVIHDIGSFSKQKKTKQTIEPAQYGLEINFKTPLPLRISNDPLWWGYGYFLEPHSISVNSHHHVVGSGFHMMQRTSSPVPTRTLY